MRVKVGGKYYNLHFTRLKGKAWGYCDPPNTPQKRIWIHNRMGSKKTMEILIHEMLHALSWHIDEDHVAQAAHDMATVLDKVGYKRDGKRE
jgi:hypothetical protein